MFHLRWFLCGNFVVASLLLWASMVRAEHEQWGPWGKEGSYLQEVSSRTLSHHESPNFLTKASTLPLTFLILIFQKVISPVDGATCNFYPTCSTYARQALEKHGLIIGLAMASERINRDHSSAGYELIYKFGRYYLYDPVEYNDFWFHHDQDKGP